MRAMFGGCIATASRNSRRVPTTRTSALEVGRSQGPPDGIGMGRLILQEKDLQGVVFHSGYLFQASQ